MTLPVYFSTLHGGPQPLSLLDRQFAAVGALVTIPCDYSSIDGNAIVLTPRANTPVITGYTDLVPEFAFVAAQQSSGPVTINVMGQPMSVWDSDAGSQPPGSGQPQIPAPVPLGAKPAFKDDGVYAVGTTDIVAGGVYTCRYVQSLGGQNGGFLVSTLGDLRDLFVDLTSWLPWTPQIASSTGTITSASGNGVARHIGPSIEFTMTLTVGSNGTGGGYLIASLDPGFPVAAQFAACGINANGSSVVGLITQEPPGAPIVGPVVRLFNYDSSYPASVDGTVIVVNGLYFTTA